MKTNTHHKLIDGSTPLGPEDLFAHLDELGVPFETLEHPPVFTVREARKLRGQLPGAHTKNFFLRDKKEQHWLVSCFNNRTVDLMWLADHLGTKRLTFCSARRLMQYLGITKGSVSPFALLNDVTGTVNVALDRDMLEKEPLNFHPLENSMTTSVSKDGLLRFLQSVDHEPRMVPFPDEEANW